MVRIDDHWPVTSCDWMIGAGAALQFLGVLGVAVGIWDTRRRFTGRQGIVQAASAKVVRWVNRLGRWGRDAVLWVQARLVRRPPPTPPAHQVVSVTAADEIKLGESAIVEKWPGDQAGQILALREAISTLKSRLRSVENDLIAHRSVSARDFTRLESGVDALAEKLDERIKDLAGHGLRIEALAAALLLVGIVLSLIGALCG